MKYPSLPPSGAFEKLELPKPRFFTSIDGITPILDDEPAWRHMLRALKYPTTVLVLDFETYFDSDYGMKSPSTIEYINDRRFEVLGLAHLTMTATSAKDYYQAAARFEVGEDRVASHVHYLKGLHGPNLEGCVVSCHNAKFDLSVLCIKYGLVPKYVIDTLDLARAWNARQRHGLKDLAAQWELPSKGDTEEFKGLTLKVRYQKPKGTNKPKMPVRVPVATDAQIDALAHYAKNDAMRQWELFTILLPRLSNPVVETRVMRHTLDLYLQPRLGVDFNHGNGLIKTFQAELDKAVQATGQTPEEISGDKSFAALLTDALAAAGEDIKKYQKIMKRGVTFALAKTDDARELLVKHSDARVRTLMTARIAQDSWPGHIGRVENILAQARNCGGLLPVALHYHGASTGRLSGGEKLNLQNLPKAGVLAGIRKLLIAPPGYKLVVVDASQIEARVLSYLAGQNDLTAKFRNNEEIYCGFASKVLGYPVRKPRKTGIPAVEARMTWARNSIGKIGILGGGYGMGQEKFFALGAGAFDFEMAGKIKDTYRSENAEIVKFWGAIERAFIHTAKYHTPSGMTHGVRFDSYPDCDVVMTLPNGRELHYLKVKIVRGPFGGDSARVFNAREMTWEHIWGGTLTENLVQAVSRDILVEAMLRMEDLGVPVVLTVHDEVVGLVESNRADEALNIAISEMARTPTWAEGLPLGAEGSIMECYQK